MNEEGRQLISYTMPYGAEVAGEGRRDAWRRATMLASWDPYNSVIVSRSGRHGPFQDVIEGTTYREESDEQTGFREKVITETRERNLTPAARHRGRRTAPEYTMPVRARLQVDDGRQGSGRARCSPSSRGRAAKTRDITGGLPRVIELFEARQPTDPAVVTEIDGVVSFGGRKRGSQEVIVTSPRRRAGADLPRER